MRSFTDERFNRPREVKLFDSVAELADFAYNPEGGARQELSLASSSALFSREFVGRSFYTWEECHKAANGVWEEGVEKVQAMLDEILDEQTPDPVSRRRRRRWSEQDGDEICIDRLRCGQGFWRQSYRTFATGPANKTLVIQLGGIASRHFEQLAWRGVAALALATRMEQAGYGVEIWGVSEASGTYHDNAGAAVGVQLKTLGSCLDVATLATAISGWFFRTAIFGVRTHSHDGRTCSLSMGYTEVPDAETCREVTGQSDVTLVADFYRREAALEWLRSQLKELAADRELVG